MDFFVTVKQNSVRGLRCHIKRWLYN